MPGNIKTRAKGNCFSKRPFDNTDNNTQHQTPPYRLVPYNTVKKKHAWCYLMVVMPIFALTPKLYPAAYIRPILYVRTVNPKLFLDEDFVAGCVYNITPSFHKRNVSSIIQHNNIECCKKKDKNGPRTRETFESLWVRVYGTLVPIAKSR